MKDKTAQYKLKYLTIPDYVYSDKRINQSQEHVYGFINSYTGIKGFQFSNKQIATMFGMSESSVTKAISKLEEYGYLKLSYRIRAGGGKVRIIENVHPQARLVKDYQSDSERITSQTSKGMPVYRKRIKKENKGKKEKINKKENYSSLKSISNGVVNEIADKYSVPVFVVEEIREDLVLYCKSNGKRYADYKAALMNWVRRRIAEKPELKVNKNNDPLVEATMRRINAR